MSGLAPCTHEEADTLILLHLEDAVRHGNTRVSIHTVDTDVVVLAVASAQRLNISELWIAFGAGKSFRFLACHEIARALGPDRCIALPIFHAFTGFDTVSCFSGRGKRTAWDTWNAYGNVTLHSVPWLPGQPHNPYKNGQHYWNNLSSCYMILPVARTLLTKQESSCLLREAEQ